MFALVRYLDALPHQERKMWLSTQINEGEKSVYKLGLIFASPQLVAMSTGNTYWFQMSGPKWFMACSTQATTLSQKKKK